MDIVKNKIETIAILSNDEAVYSETFIAAHKNLLPFTVKYYYGGLLPQSLNGERLDKQNRFQRLKRKVSRKLFPTNFSEPEHFIMQSFQKEGVKAVLAEYGTSGAKILNVCKQLRLPLFVHFHGYDISVKQVVESNRKAYAQMFEYATAIFSVSTVMTKMLVDAGCPGEKIIYNTYGPNPEFLTVNPQFDSDHFIGIGRFTDKKAPYLTLLAFQKVLDKFPAATLTLAGDGYLWNTCKNLVSSFKMENQVFMPGPIQRQEFIHHLKHSLAFVQHSITALSGDMEGTPVAMLEACAAGVPVISTKHAGIADVIRNEENGLLVNEKDVDGMAEYMIFLLENKDKARELGRNAKENIIQNYTLERHIDLIAKTINRYL